MMNEPQAVKIAQQLSPYFINVNRIAVASTPGNEIFFKSKTAPDQDSVNYGFLKYDTGYYVDNGVTKLIPTRAQHYASKQTGSIYGVLELQGWVNGNPPRDKPEIQRPAE
jgi:hypothetical protein